MSRGAWLLVAAGAALAACGNERGPDKVNFERMIDQQRTSTWRRSDFFADHRAMRTPPPGTLPRASGAGRDPAVETGIVGDHYVTKIPVQVTRPLLERGRARFETYCATCHGIEGDGLSPVASKMTLRRPPSLVTGPVRDVAPGRVFHAITEGYGLMRPYVEDLPTVEERWAVVAYVRALSRRTAVPLDDLPDAARRRALEELR
ncbi:MAG TPA: cytochrome c [Minicystis sp.]|nr:cytochrome c [Minicystis sp.]